MWVLVYANTSLPHALSLPLLEFPGVFSRSLNFRFPPPPVSLFTYGNACAFHDKGKNYVEKAVDSGSKCVFTEEVVCGAKFKFTGYGVCDLSIVIARN